MARQIKKRNKNPYIVVFWERESEKEYMKFIRREFHERANLKINKKKGIFLAAEKVFRSQGELREEAEEIDEIWFLFDTEPDMRANWDAYHTILQRIKKQCKHANIRLLMTKGCIEYFFLLHYEKTAPMIMNPADKEMITQRLKSCYCPSYEKGHSDSTFEIAAHYRTGITNGQWSLNRLEALIGDIAVSEERDRRLFMTEHTFTNAHEGILYLLSLNKYEAC